MSDSVRSHRWQPTRLPCPWDSPGKNTGVGCQSLQCMKVKSESELTQSCPTLCNPMDCSLPGSSIHEIFQARVLEWGAIAFSTGNQWDAPKAATPATGIGEQNRPNSYSQHHPTAIILQNNAVLHNTQPILQKLNELGYEVLLHPPYSSNLWPNDYHFFKHLNSFCRENASTTSKMQKIFSKSSSNLKAQIFMLQK